MLNLNYNINNTLRNQRNFLKGKVDYRWRRTITTAAGIQSGSIIFGTGSIDFVPFDVETYYISGTYDVGELSSGSAIGQAVTMKVTGSGVWPTTGSNSMYILIGSSLGFNQNEILNMSAQAGNMNLSGSVISSSFFPVLNNEYNIDFGVNHTKGNIYNPLVLWKTMQEEDITELSTNFPINGYTSSFNIVKNENELLVNVKEVSGSFSSSFQYLYNFGVTASLTASINNATGSTTMSFFVPESGLSEVYTFFNPTTTIATATGSFVATSDSPYNLTASIEYNKGNQSTASIDYIVSSSSTTFDLQGNSTNLNGVSASFQLKKDATVEMAYVANATGSQSGSYNNAFALNQTASLVSNVNNTTGSVTMSITIPAEGVSVSQRFFNPTTTQAVLTASFVATGNDVREVTASVINNKGNISNSDINWRATASSTTQDLEGDASNLNGPSSSFQLKKDIGVIVNLSELTGSFSGSYKNDYSFNQTASLTQNVNNTTGSVTMSIIIPTEGINITQRWVNTLTTQAVLTASFVPYENNPFYVTASVINNKGNESNSNINWEVTGSYGDYILNSTASFQIEKDTSYNKQTLVDLDLEIAVAQTSSFKNAWAFNMTASLSSSYVPYSSSADENTFLLSSIQFPQNGVDIWSVATSSILTASWEGRTSINNYDVTGSVRKYTTRLIDYVVIGGGGGGGLPYNTGGGNGGGAGGGAGAVVTGSIKMLKQTPYSILVGRGGYTQGFQFGTTDGTYFNAESSSVIGEVVPYPNITPATSANLVSLPYIIAPGGGLGASQGNPNDVDGGSGGGQRADAAVAAGLSVSASVIVEGQMTSSNLPYGSCGVIGLNRTLTTNPGNPGQTAFIGGNGGSKETIVSWLEINSGLVGGFGRRGDNAWSSGITASYGAVASSTLTLPVVGSGAGGGGSYRTGATATSPRPGATGSISFRYSGSAVAAGGIVVSKDGYTTHTFLTSSEFIYLGGSEIAPSVPLTIEYLVVGKGGNTGQFSDGGAGGGQAVTGSTSISINTSTSASFNTIIGGYDLSSSSSLSIVDPSTSSYITASVGGDAVGFNTGGTSGNGFAGGTGEGNFGGGGGGAAAIGGNNAGNQGGSGGNGLQWVDGNFYGGGGGGAPNTFGGLGGGGRGAITGGARMTGQPGVANTGGGAGGNYRDPVTGGAAGGSGVVKLRYYDPSGKYEVVNAPAGAVEKSLIGNYTYITLKQDLIGANTFYIKLNA